MWTDPIVEEVRQIKIAHAAEFNHDLRAMYRSLKAEEEASGRTFVSYERKTTADSPELEGQRAAEPCEESTVVTGASPAA